jgi:5,10-methylenetetrahydromethanopterin reductase
VNQAIPRPVMLSAAGLPYQELGERVRLAEQAGADQIWTEQFADQRDIGVVAGEYLRAAATARVGTAVLPIRSRHPVATAQLAATLDELSGGRFLLGLGLSHPLVNEVMLGLPPVPPLRLMSEYVTAVRRLLADGSVRFEGRYVKARAVYSPPRRPDLPIYLAGLRPRMIRLAVRLGDGLLLWLCPLPYIREHVLPAVRAACAEFDRDPDRFPVLAFVDVAREREALREAVASYAMIPTYRQVIEAAGLAAGRLDGPVLDALTATGTESAIRGRLGEYREAGCLPVPAPFARTREEFAELLAAVL